jgi:hypothetical protein
VISVSSTPNPSWVFYGLACHGCLTSIVGGSATALTDSSIAAGKPADRGKCKIRGEMCIYWKEKSPLKRLPQRVMTASVLPGLESVWMNNFVCSAFHSSSTVLKEIKK